MTTLAPSELALDGLRREIEAELTASFTRRSDDAAALGEDFHRLWHLAATHVGGGKLVRPSLLLRVHDALRDPGESSPRDRATILDLAVGVELLHFALLLHDDVIDGDFLRRGRSNLVGTLRRVDADRASTAGRGLHWARSSAILMGDLMLATAHQSFARVDLDRDTRLRLLDVLDHVMHETIAGEHVDVGLSDGVIPPTLDAVLTMTARKTAAYSFELPLRTAALLAGATAETHESLARIGRDLGVAFQLQDDLLSTFGDERAHGKDGFSDLRGGKQTAIIAYARTTASWPRIADTFGASDLSESEARRMRELLRSCGAESYVQQLIDERLASVRELLDGGAIPPAVRGVLTDLMSQLDGRRA